MKNRFFISKKILRIILLAMLTLLITLFIFRKQIMDHPVTKAKLEMFKTLKSEKPKHWNREFKSAIDSLLMPRDSTRFVSDSVKLDINR